MYSLCDSHVFIVVHFFFFKQKTAYEMRISDWSSDVCSSDLYPLQGTPQYADFLFGPDRDTQIVADARSIEMPDQHSLLAKASGESGAVMPPMAGEHEIGR